jgi:predicted RNA-binding Zn-ribbon protein involved in translation (DUF1610 family)
MRTSGTFTCPACGADFEVQERVEEEGRPVALPVVEESMVVDERPHEEAISFQCPACGADYDTQETLPEEADARH